MKDRQELEALVARARALEKEVTKANAVNASQQQALDQLVADIETYNAATKRFDISVERAVFTTPNGGQPAYSTPHRDDDKCDPCPVSPPNRPQGYICWLDNKDSFCDPRTGIRVCSYTCVQISLIPFR
jgi:hypothetical protein